MNRILVGAEAAEYLKAHVVQEAVETCRGVKLTIHARPSTKLELEVIVKLIDSLIADCQPEELEMNLYSARLHVVRAIREAAK